MRLLCYFCLKSVSTEIPKETIVRACHICPECIEAGKIKIPEPRRGKSLTHEIIEKIRKGQKD